MSFLRFTLSLYPLDTMDYITTATPLQSAECTNIATTFCAKSQTLLLSLTNYRVWNVYALRRAETALKMPFVFDVCFYG